MAQTANQKLYDAAVRHHVSLLRFAEGQAEEAQLRLSESETELLDKIMGAMARGASTARWEELLKSIKETRAEVIASLGRALKTDLADLAETDAEWEAGAIESSSPIALTIATVPPEQLKALVETPINGLALDRWLDNLAEREALALQRAVSLAILQGESIDSLVRRIRGTRANNYNDGILTTTTRNAEALARTAVSHVSNAARELMWEANSEIVRALRWTSTLDGRTSSVCQGRDGKLAPVGDSLLEPSELPLIPPGARPPAHFNCRSVMVAVLDGVAIAGNRPFVADARVRAERERQFRQEAKKQNKDIREIRQNWADTRVGQVPSETDYTAWLKRQSKDFQDDVLGPARAKLFRSGTPLERFVDTSGRKLTLKELRKELGLP